MKKMNAHEILTVVNEAIEANPDMTQEQVQDMLTDLCEDHGLEKVEFRELLRERE